MLQVLLILRFLKACVKIFNVLLILALSIAIANNIKKVKVVFDVTFFLISFCFLLIIFTNLLILLFATR